MSTKIPVANDTRWSSHLRLHEHILKNMDNINEALEKIKQPNLSDKENLSSVVEVMSYFSQATDILQCENTPTSSHVIPVIDSLENALKSIDRSQAAINALCERMLRSLQQRFSYLLHSDIYQVSSLLDPSIKLSFTDNESTNGSKFFVFSLAEVKAKLRSLLPLEPDAAVLPSPESANKKRKLLDFSSATTSAPKSIDGTSVEIQNYLDQPLRDINPITFWAERENTPLSQLALQLLSVPSSSAPVERLFSKAGCILSQRRTRIRSEKLEHFIMSE